MKVCIQDNKKNTIPQIGQLWRHKASKKIYMRIQDCVHDIFSWVNEIDNFFSVNIQTGEVVYTSKNTTDIEFLELVDDCLKVKAV
jgi:hypothetical protein